MRKLVAFFAFAAIAGAVQAQELKCQVKVISPTVQGSNTQVYEDLQSAVFEFMNNTRWTGDKFKLEERIECTILITITDRPQNDVFKGNIQVTSSRPVFKSDYQSKMMEVKDNNFNFRYLQNATLQFTPDQHRSNLSSVLAFYAYYIIGLDYDSYSMEGGTPYLVKAQQIVNNAQSAPESGWKAHEGSQNRYWLIDNYLHRQFKPLRLAYYTYHRTGFDKVYDDIDGGRTGITETLEALKKVHQARPGSYNLQVWFQAKSDEIVNLYKVANPQEKTRIFNTLKMMDASRLSKYQKILSNKR